MFYANSRRALGIAFVLVACVGQPAWGDSVSSRARPYRRAGVAPELAKSIVAHHTTPEQAGEVFARTKPRLAVYSHIARPTATEQDLVPATRKTYSGALEVGEDMMVIEVGDKITVRRPVGARP